MNRKQLVRTFFIGLYSLIFSLFVATTFFERTGELVLLKEAAIAAFLISSAVLIGSLAVQCWASRRKLATFVATICAIGALVAGSGRTMEVIKDLQYGQQTVTLTNCQLTAPINEDVFGLNISIGYAVQGQSSTGNTYLFPLTKQEYMVLKQQMNSSPGAWNLEAVAYIHCERVVTYTAKRVSALPNVELYVGQTKPQTNYFQRLKLWYPTESIVKTLSKVPH